MCGHPHNGPADILPDGTCRHCDRIRQAKYKTRRGEAMTLLRGLETNGIDVTDIGNKADKVAVALKIFERCGINPVRAESVWRRNPEQFARLMQAMDKL